MVIDHLGYYSIGPNKSGNLYKLSYLSYAISRLILQALLKQILENSNKNKKSASSEVVYGSLLLLTLHGYLKYHYSPVKL